MDSVKYSTEERLRNLCRRGGGKSNGNFQELKGAEKEQMGRTASSTQMQEQNHTNAGSDEESDENTATDTEIERAEGDSEKGSASEEESDEETATDTEIDEVGHGVETEVEDLGWD